MAKTIGLSGDQAAAYAAKQSNVDVVAAYPITPQTIIVEEFSNYVADGEVETEYVCVESEHSAMSASIGASLTGARTFTATASQGLALMHEMLYIASGLRCPIVLCNVNRALSSPINIHCDHSDMMGSRDSGWIQIYAENAQEVYDWLIQAFRIAEDEKVQLPVAVNLDGFTISHSLEDIIVLEDEEVKEFVKTRTPHQTLDPQNPVAYGSLVLQNFYFEMKVQVENATQNSFDQIRKVNEEYAQISKRRYGAIESQWMDGANAVVICLGSTFGTAKVVAKRLNEAGIHIGIVKPWLYRPFPSEEIVRILKDVSAVTVLDRAASPGAAYGPLASDVISTLYKYGKKMAVKNDIYGLGGRDLSPREMETVMRNTIEIAEGKEMERTFEYVGVRE
ncbi:pyruvate ferredoxin oxidoreductase [[Eubacterium] cellulosolvens]